ncbi:MAG: stress-induced morphogen [Bermanella sp.]|uniref:BolA/IbaG family iron-sulfur metabolism protein n=1 Tax=Glaciecola sp. 33A TaxID=2057807 RepID=UPI000C31D3F1|nr:BolA/IbaG family iron-sulfur metabolism protein [Glaciecola sp. 33A]PKI02820.1 BolA family transcriptional regulator [Glaciecola sp. 33A]
MNINEKIQDIITNKISDAQVTVRNMGGGHFNLVVTTQEFIGKNTLAKHKLVLSAIAPLMSGPGAPVHAIDTLETMLPTA